MKVKNISGGTIDFRDYPNGMKRREPDEVFDLKKEIADRLLASEKPSIEIYDPAKEEEAKKGGTITKAPKNTKVVTAHPGKGDLVDLVVTEDGKDDVEHLGLDEAAGKKLVAELGLDMENAEQCKWSDEPLHPEEDVDLVATIHPVEGEPKLFDVVLDDGDDEPQKEIGLDQKAVDALLDKMNLDPKNEKEVKHSDKPLEDRSEGTDLLKAYIHPTDDPKKFDLVLDDEDDDPEVLTGQTEKQIATKLGEMGLDPSNKLEVIRESKPYTAPTPE